MTKMANHQRGKTGVPDAETIQRLQEQYAKAVRARGLPPEVEAKLARMHELSIEDVAEVMPLVHFKVDDVDWDAPDVQHRLARGEMVWREGAKPEEK
jgi:hypothetical protein